MTTVPKNRWAADGSTRAAVGLTLLICLAFAGVIFRGLGEGTLDPHDELRTAERGREFLVTGEWDKVHDNFEVSFKKPPLQYYLTAFTLSRLDDPELAVRMWSALYGVGCVAAAGVLAWVLVPASPFVMPLAAAATAVSEFVIGSARHGMLDLGVGFYVTLTLIFVALSRTYSGAWILAGLFAGVGAWQKSPHALGVFAAAPVLRAVAYKGTRKLCTSSFFTGCALALAVGFAWTVLQTAQFGGEAIARFYGDEIWRRWSEGGRHWRPWLVVAWILQSWRGFGAFALVALTAGIVSSKKWRQPQIGETAALVALFIVLTGVSEHLKPRYIVPIIPAVAATAIAAGSAFLGSWVGGSSCAGGRMPAAAWALLLFLIATGIPSAVREYSRDLDHSRFQAEAARALAAASSESERLVFVQAKNQTRLYKDHMLFYGKLDRPVEMWWRWPDGTLSAQAAPLRGLCHTENWDEFRSVNPGVTLESRHGPIIHWVLRSGLARGPAAGPAPAADTLRP